MRGALTPISSLPLDVQYLLRAKYGNKAESLTLLDQSLYSTVRFRGVRTAGPPVSFAIDTSPRVAFAYGLGAPMTGAGFAVADGNATFAETNLATGSQTRDNADFIFWAMGIQPRAKKNEPAILAQLADEVAVTISIGGNTNIPMGLIPHYPGAGGLFGAGRSFLKVPSIEATGAGDADNGAGAAIGFVTNGNPMAGNFRRYFQPFFWSKTGSGSADTAVNVVLAAQHAITETAGLARAAVAAGTANMAAGLFTPPADGGPGSLCDLVITLYGISVGARSANV